MHILYYTDENNFGDQLNAWLWPKLLPQLNIENLVFLGIGSILHLPEQLGIEDSTKKIIFGAGYAYSQPPRIDESWKVYFVRGKSTARKLNISDSYAISDSAYLIRLIEQPDYKENSDKVSFMLHHKTCKNRKQFFSDICEEQGINYIDPHDSVENIIHEIKSSKRIITEAMHGAIIADALRVPWLPIISTNSVNTFKWNDWCNSINLDFKPKYLMNVYYLKIFSKIIRSTNLLCDNIKNETHYQRITGKASKKFYKRIISKTLSKLMENDVKFYISSDDTIARIDTKMSVQLDTLIKDLLSMNQPLRR